VARVLLVRVVRRWALSITIRCMLGPTAVGLSVAARTHSVEANLLVARIDHEAESGAELGESAGWK
jgi:hypothetical protein